LDRRDARITSARQPDGAEIGDAQSSIFQLFQ
jgi:hypothetical protein